MWQWESALLGSSQLEGALALGSPALMLTLTDRCRGLLVGIPPSRRLLRTIRTYHPALRTSNMPLCMLLTLLPPRLGNPPYYVVVEP